MDAGSFPLATPLNWLKGEIDRSLGQARKTLARSVGEAGTRRSQTLRDCTLPVRHIRGALEMLRLQGAGRFCGAVEQAIESFAADPARLNELTASVVDRALFALSQFLDDLAKGEPDVPLKLFPVYRELCACSGRGDAAEIELFFPDLAAAPERAHCPEQLDEEERTRYLATWRSRFQRGLVAWFKNAEDIDALRAMRAAVEAIDRIGNQLDTPAQLWWVAAGLLDLLIDRDPQTQRTALKPLLLRLERRLRSLGAAAQPDADALLREMLYPIALAAPVCGRVRDIKSAYRLDAQVPEFCVSGTLEYDVGALAPVLDEMQQKLVAMEDAWAHYTDGSGEDLKRLRTEAGALKAIARDLGHYRMVRLLDIVTLIAAKLPEAYPADNDVLALEMAAALLFMEGMLDHFTSPPTDIDQQVAVMVGWLLDAVKPRGLPAPGTGAPRDDITQREQHTEVRAQVAREILVNLGRVEQALEAIVRDADAARGIGALEAPMRQIAGALELLGLGRANGVLSACLHLMTVSACEDPALRRVSLEWVADGLSCLGFYLDNVCHGETPNEEMLLGFVQRLNRDGARAAGSTGWVSPARPDAPSGADAPVIEPDAPAHAGAVQTSAESEPSDLRTVYLEEAGGILSGLRAWSRRLRSQPGDAAALIEVRRGFHTLKGSARVVGLDVEASLAWEVEQTLNAVLESRQEASDELLVLIDEAVESFAALVETRGRGLEPESGAHAHVAELAAALRAADAMTMSSGEPHAEPDARAPACTSNEADAAREEDAHNAACALDTADASASHARLPAPGVALQDASEAEDEIAIGEVRLSATLYRIYRDECTTLLATVHGELARLAAEPASPVPEALLRAAHTLRSTSNTLGFEPVGALAGAFDDVLQRVQVGPVPAPCVSALETAARALGTMLSAIRAQRAPSRDLHAEQALRAIAGLAEADARAQPWLTASLPAPSGQPDAQLAALVRDEAHELLERLASELARWRALPASIEPPRAMARALHTLKGSLRMAGAVHAAALVHALESRLGMAIEGGQADAALFAEVTGELDRIAESIGALESAPGSDRDASHPQTAAGSAQVGINAATLDALVAQAGEVSIVRARVQAELADVRQAAHDLTDSVARLRALLRETQVEADSQMQSRSGRPGGGEPGFDPLELDRYTRLQELTRMMAESLHDVQLSQQALVASSAEAETALALQGRVVRAMQQQLVGLRSLPFGALRERLERTLRQSAQALGRDAELVIEGGDVELDRDLLHRLLAPLEHLLRNALAHGIEAPDVRNALGKPRAGCIALRLERRGLGVELALSDDGAGLDRERIAAAAGSLGLIAAGAKPTDAELHELIFAPGLSTAEALTESAGRGIGLDAARAEIAALGGRIEVATTPGRGTRFHIRLPLSPASAQVLLVRAGAGTYALPSNLVDAVEELAAPALQQAYADGAVGAYPLCRLPHLLGADEDAAAVARHNAVVLLRSGEQRIALHVDQVLRSQEAVLKPLGPQLARAPGLAGITVLGQDEPVLVLDPFGWSTHMRSARTGSRFSGARAAALGADPLHIMVVDDSLTVRRLTARLLSRAGYEVSTAKDGADALQQIERALPDLVVIDLEMPRMDGFEFARHMRAHACAARVPIVVVTSRLAEKHRRRAAEMGVDAFFGKPYAEDELLACIAGLLGGRAAVRAA